MKRSLQETGRTGSLSVLLHKVRCRAHTVLMHLNRGGSAADKHAPPGGQIADYLVAAKAVSLSMARNCSTVFEELFCYIKMRL